jgi:antitoxin PrlF
MAYSSVVSSKGQVTIPHQIRARLGLKEGDRLEFTVEGDRTVIRPARTAENPFRAYAGVLGTFPGGVDEINAWIADLRGDPKK